jgi:hypothetical protein
LRRKQELLDWTRVSAAPAVGRFTGAAIESASSVRTSPDGMVTSTDAAASINAFANASSAKEVMAMSSKTTVLSATRLLRDFNCAVAVCSKVA